VIERRERLEIAGGEGVKPFANELVGIGRHRRSLSSVIR
jgi:hypothetical protein